VSELTVVKELCKITS